MTLLKVLKGYWLEIVIGAVLIYFDFRLFLYFFFIVYLISSERRTDYLRKLIRTFHVANEVKILTLMKKSKVTEQDVEQTLETSYRQKMTEEAYDVLTREVASVSNIDNLK